VPELSGFDHMDDLGVEPAPFEEVETKPAA
jgi:hypothetical protein